MGLSEYKYWARTFYDRAHGQIDRAIHEREEAEERRNAILRSLGREGDPEYWAERNPQRSTVSEVVRQGREFMDPTSETYQGTYRRLTEDAENAIRHGMEASERTLAADARAAEAEMIRIGDQRGAGRNPVAQSNIRARHFERTGMHRAQIQTEGARDISQIRARASQWLEEYSRTFALNSVKFANEWVNMQPFVREAYVGALEEAFFARAQLYENMAHQQFQFGQLDAQIESAEAQRRNDLIMGIVGGVLSVASLGVGALVSAPALGALGSTLASTATSSLGSSGSSAGRMATYNRAAGLTREGRISTRFNYDTGLNYDLSSGSYLNLGY